ncbi:glycoside hydrolase superfamily [Lipomyces doorenjongii]
MIYVVMLLSSKIPRCIYNMSTLDVEDAIGQLTLDEKVKLISGGDFWHTASIPEANIPAIRFSDGPNGVRGTRFFNGVSSAAFPCGTALGATWNTDLLMDAGRTMGEEAKAKGVHVILGPTVNMQRSPLGGRAFESFSEDPVLSGMSASSIIQGIQSTGVLATIKHFVCNDQEDERNALNVIVSQRALREIYLKPFQVAIKDAHPACVMTSYNKVNGQHASENKYLIEDILRGEWGWKGLIVSDWYGVYSTSESVNAGVDIEMPGPIGFRGELVNRAIVARTIHQHILDERVRGVLRLVNKATQSGVLENAPEHTRDLPETRAQLRKIAGESIVLLKNDDQILPFKRNRTIAVMGPNAKVARLSGGGSASLFPYYSITPLEGILAKVSISDVKYMPGVRGFDILPTMGSTTKSPSGEIGVLWRTYLKPHDAEDRKPIDEIHLQDANVFLADYNHPAIKDISTWYAELIGIFTPEESGEYEFGVIVYGTAKLYVDDIMVVDNETVQTQGEAFFGCGTVQETGRIFLECGRAYEIKVQFGNSSTCKLRSLTVTVPGGGLRVGFSKAIDDEEAILNAVEVAKCVDQVVLCVGLSGDIESEGFDRKDMKLPGNTNKFISAILHANSNTAVIVQSGSSVEMPWAKCAKSILQAWYGGNETGNAIADVLFGDVNPSGKLPISFPLRLQDNPAYLNYKAEGGRILYGEDIYIGYRYYEYTEREVLFPFGHGLCLSNMDVYVDEITGSLRTSVKLSHIKGPAGAEVELKAFKKLFIEPGMSETITFELDLKEATSFFDEITNSWVSEKGTYAILVGTSSIDDHFLRDTFEIKHSVWWKGL